MSVLEILQAIQNLTININVTHKHFHEVSQNLQVPVPTPSESTESTTETAPFEDMFAELNKIMGVDTGV